MTKPARISYGLMALLLVLIGWLHLATLVLTVMFGYFALRQLSFGRSKLLGLSIYILSIGLITYGLFYFSRQAAIALPTIAETSTDAVLKFAEKRHLELPFTNYAEMKTMAATEAKEQVAKLGLYARKAAFEIVLLLVGLVVAASMFLNAKWLADNDPDMAQDSLYATVVRELGLRFRLFYKSFATVIGAQIIISAINTFFTAVFLFWNHFPYAMVLVGLTFLCGLLPIIGNLISNTLIIGVAFTISPETALLALIFLVVIHKGEYFLNSKIIGDRIKNPMWLTLIGIVIGEKLMGIPGMILAPVVLHYIKTEASRNKVADSPGAEIEPIRQAETESDLHA